jgi:hypothetical protein
LIASASALASSSRTTFGAFARRVFRFVFVFGNVSAAAFLFRGWFSFGGGDVAVVVPVAVVCVATTCCFGIVLGVFFGGTAEPVAFAFASAADTASFSVIGSREFFFAAIAAIFAFNIFAVPFLLDIIDLFFLFGGIFAELYYVVLFEMK